MGVITFDGRESTSYGIQVEKPPAYNIAEKSYEAISIPGRNGDLYFDNNKSYKNVPRTYDVSFYNENGNMETVANKLYEFLYSPTGYARLEDTYDADVFRLAYFSGPVDIENILFKAGRGKLKFTCKPQRFLKSGEEAWVFWSDYYSRSQSYYPAVDMWDRPLFEGYTVTHRIAHDEWEAQSSRRIPNLTRNDCYPLLRLICNESPGDSCVLTIRNWTITYTVPNDPPPYIDIDCETMEASYDGAFYNSYIVFNTTSNIKFPARSESRIVMQSGVKYAVRIIPRTWIL